LKLSPPLHIHWGVGENSGPNDTSACVKHRELDRCRSTATVGKNAALGGTK